MIQRWERIGDSYIAVSHENRVCGVLRNLEDVMVIRPPTMAKNRNLEVRTTMLREKHHAMDQKRSKRRKEAKSLRTKV